MTLGMGGNEEGPETVELMIYCSRVGWQNFQFLVVLRKVLEFQ